MFSEEDIGDIAPLIAGIILIVLCLWAVIDLTGCAPPPISELLKNGVDCQADITMPAVETRPGQVVKVAVKIHDCKDIPK